MTYSTSCVCFVPVISDETKHLFSEKVPVKTVDDDGRQIQTTALKPGSFYINSVTNNKRENDVLSDDLSFHYLFIETPKGIIELDCTCIIGTGIEVTTGSEDCHIRSRAAMFSLNEVTRYMDGSEIPELSFLKGTKISVVLELQIKSGLNIDTGEVNIAFGKRRFIVVNDDEFTIEDQIDDLGHLLAASDISYTLDAYYTPQE